MWNWGCYEVRCADNVSFFISNNSRKLNESFLVSLIVIVFRNALQYVLVLMNFFSQHGRGEEEYVCF